MKEVNYKPVRKKRLQGRVISDRMNKTIVVEVERSFRHPAYEKVIKKKKKYYAHDGKEVSKPGDLVTIEQTRPLSKLKRWRIIEVKQ